MNFRNFPSVNYEESKDETIGSSHDNLILIGKIKWQMYFVQHRSEFWVDETYIWNIKAVSIVWSVRAGARFIAQDIIYSDLVNKWCFFWWLIDAVELMRHSRVMFLAAECFWTLLFAVKLWNETGFLWLVYHHVFSKIFPFST